MSESPPPGLRDHISEHDHAYPPMRPESLVEVLDDRQTGETILDEALRMMKGQEQERMAVNSWIDLLSGE